MDGGASSHLELLLSLLLLLSSLLLLLLLMCCCVLLLSCMYIFMIVLSNDVLCSSLVCGPIVQLRHDSLDPWSSGAKCSVRHGLLDATTER